MRIVLFPNSSGASFWRLLHPAKYLRRQGVEIVVPTNGITEDIVQWGDVFVLQGTVDKHGIALLHAYQQEKGKKIVVDCDDWLEVEEDNPHKLEHSIAQASTVVGITLEIADLVTTTTEYLATKLRRFNKNVLVLPNYMDMETWLVESPKKKHDQIRIGWAGSLTHIKDLELVIGVLEKLMDKYPVKLIFMGDPRVRDFFTNKSGVECMLGVPFENYPKRLHGLGLDIGIVPLRDTEFNKCKSYIKPLEYGINGIPSVVSGVQPYKELGEKVYLVDHPSEWIENLEMLVQDASLREEVGEEMKKYVLEKYNLKDHAGRWFDAYSSLA